MHCNGKCYLAKQLKEQQKQEQAPVSKKDNQEVQLFLSIPESNNDQTAFNSKKRYHTYHDIRVFSFPRSVFHPPGV